ncbi:MAG: thioredoxin family protein [Candidatus Verstraetearchaeota archaeon]|nr:thioredoxin family protein [Candidatus Verstraetearchaeota archaeon]
MSKIFIFGGEPPCARCKATEKIMREAAKELKLEVEIVHVSALSPEADKYDILSTPAVVVNDKVVFSGRVPDLKSAKEILKKEFGI